MCFFFCVMDFFCQKGSFPAKTAKHSGSCCLGMLTKKEKQQQQTNKNKAKQKTTKANRQFELTAKHFLHLARALGAGI